MTRNQIIIPHFPTFFKKLFNHPNWWCMFVPKKAVMGNQEVHRHDDSFSFPATYRWVTIAKACANAADLKAAEEWYDFLLEKGGTLSADL